MKNGECGVDIFFSILHSQFFPGFIYGVFPQVLFPDPFILCRSNYLSPQLFSPTLGSDIIRL